MYLVKLEEELTFIDHSQLNKASYASDTCPSKRIGLVREMPSKKNYYPRKLRVSPDGDERVIANLKKCFELNEVFSYAEFGIYMGATAEKVLINFPNATLHLFDFERNIESAKRRLAEYEGRVSYYSNSQAYLDSYNWNLMKILKTGERNLFDYAFLDGAHVWAVDGLTFLLSDMLLKPNGYIEMDDFDWTLRGSSLDPKKNRSTRKFYTSEQIDSRQVELIIDLLIRGSGRYTELIKDRLFQKKE